MLSRLLVRGAAVGMIIALLVGALCTPAALADGPGGSPYLVQAGDSLSQLAQDYLGDSSAWPRIVEATNAKAKTDLAIAPIQDPANLSAGQTLWIPAAGLTTSRPWTELSLYSPNLSEPLTPIIGSVLYPVTPLPMADDQVHLVYDLALTNWSSQPVTLDSFKILDPQQGDAVLAEWDQDRIAARLIHKDPAKAGSTLAPGETAVLMVELVVPPDAVPEALSHELDFDPPVKAPGADMYGQHLPRVQVWGRPVVIGLPFEGDGWLAMELLEDSLPGSPAASHHRIGVFAIGNQMIVPQRFATDWLQVDAEGNLFNGDAGRAEDYVGYGAPLLAVADGSILEAVDQYPDTALPFAAAAQSFTLDNIAGNHIIQDIGGGLYVLYAHLKPGSVTVQPGDTVTRGQVLGELGQSGNSTAPHLHFHVMDKPSTTGLGGQGVAYVFDAFVDHGVGQFSLGEGDTLSYALPDPLPAQPRQNQLPLNLATIASAGAP